MAFTRMLTTYEITLRSFMALKYLIMSSSFAYKKNSLVQLTQRSLVHHLQLLGVQLALLNSHWFIILNNWPTATLFLEYHHLQLAFIDSWRNTRLRLSFFFALLSKKDLETVVALPPFHLFMIQTYIYNTSNQVSEIDT